MATIRVSRPSGIRDALRAYRVLLDGEEVGSVRGGQSVEVTTTQGSHRLAAALGYLLVGAVGSEPLEITVTDDAVAAFVVRPIGSPVFKPGDARYRRSSYLEIVAADG